VFPDPWFILLVVLIFVPLERLAPFRRGQGLLRPGWATDATYLLVNGLLIGAGVSGLCLIADELGRALVPQALRAGIAAQPRWLQVPEVLVIADLGFYTAHRTFHAVPILWRFHAVHHSIEHLDWLAGSRVHALDQILTKGLSVMPLFILGFAMEAMLLWAAIYQWHSVLLHANVRVPFGPLGRILASPHFHRWHHAREPEARDRNFAGQLALLDHLFGTAHAPARDPQSFGIDEPMPAGWHRQFIHPLAPPRASERVA
jgi:sterol desaturase/sphingolipid hydroxylase (fatty acid hydroxylase superfamily)